MKEIVISQKEIERMWLLVSYAGEETRFAYLPVRGTHQECFKAINADRELQPAEGIELALLAF